jgi:hypothetical protein
MSEDDDFLDQAFGSDFDGDQGGRIRARVIFATVDPNQTEAVTQAIAAREAEMVERVPVIFMWEDGRYDTIGLFSMIDGSDPLADLAEALGRGPTLREAEIYQENLIAEIYEAHEPLIVAAEMSS